MQGFSEKWPRGMVACGLMIALSVGPVLAEGGSRPADQTPPEPTAAQQVIIDRDNSRHFGDSPADGGPMAKLSPALHVNDVDKAVRKVADWELSRSQPYFDSIWTWSALYVGFLAATRATGDPQYRDAVQAYAVSKDWQLRAQAPGHLPNADDQSLGQAYIGLYELDHDQKRIAATRAALDALVANPDAGVAPGKFIPWWWCDALFMAPPLWTRMTAATGDNKYLFYMHREWWKTSDMLYSSTDHLYARDATYLNKTEANGQKMYWSRGNGWVMAGLVRVLQSMPMDDPMRPKYLTQFKEMSEKIASLQGKDGLWRAGLLDPQAYVLPENSGSAFFVYAMAWGLNEGVLDKSYRKVVAKGWAGLLSHVYADGRLGCIQQTGAEPAFFRPTASYNYGIGAFLLAGEQVEKLAKGKK
ncbi:MAG: glycoside hydrolase family 88/105 protein [Acidobacteriaceae bacterium]